MEHYDTVSVILIAYLICGTPLFGQAPDTMWTRAYGNNLFDAAYDVLQTSDGGYIIVGCTERRWYAYDVYLIKTDANGETLWTKTYGGPYEERGYAVQQTTDGGFIIAGCTHSFGHGEYDMYVVKTDSLGCAQWTQTYGTYDDEIARAIVTTDDGGYLIAGYTCAISGVDFEDIYIVRINATGDTLWTRVYGDYWNAEYCFSIQRAADGDYLLVGAIADLDMDIYVMKIDAQGDTISTRTYGSNCDEIGYSCGTTSDNGYIIAGCVSDTLYPYDGSIYLVKIDSLGYQQWDRKYGGSDDEVAFSVQQTRDQGYVVAGYTQSYGAGEDDVYLIKTDSLGDTLWTKAYGGFDTDEARAIRRTTDGGYIVAGYSNSFGIKNVYVLKICSEVSIQEQQRQHVRALICQNAPNPFVDKTFITFDLPVTGRVKITIYDILGATVRTLMSAEKSAGLHSTIWDGKDDAGNKVVAGLYFMNFETGGNCIVNKLSVMKR